MQSHDALFMWTTLHENGGDAATKVTCDSSLASPNEQLGQCGHVLSSSSFDIGRKLHENSVGLSSVMEIPGWVGLAKVPTLCLPISLFDYFFSELEYRGTAK